MIELTVGLPMYRSALTADVAFESLVNQKNINFNWELLIIEEQNDCFGLEKIKKYVSELKKVGCTRLEYIKIDEWVHLSQKWKKLSEISSESSKCFLLQAADCYSQPYRLKETYDIFKKDSKVSWVQSAKGYFYQLELKKMSLFDYNSPNYNHPCALNMALKTSLLKQSSIRISNSVDRDLFDAATIANNEKLKVVFNDSENWKLGVDLDGISNFSKDRKILIQRDILPFKNVAANLCDVVPKNVFKYIKSLEKHSIGHKYIV